MIPLSFKQKYWNEEVYKWRSLMMYDMPFYLRLISIRVGACGNTPRSFLHPLQDIAQKAVGSLLPSRPVANSSIW
jgi:hypothetical protein